MPKGPFGGPRPFAEYECNVVLVVYIDYDKRYGAEHAHQLEDAIADISGFSTRKDRRDVKSYGNPSGAYVVVPYQWIEIGALKESANDIHGKLLSRDDVLQVNIYVDAGDAQQILEEQI